MTIDYKQLFNNKVEAEQTRQQLNQSRIDAAKADLVELHNVLIDVVEGSDVLVEAIEDSVDITVAYDNKELTVKMDTDDVVDVVVSEKAITFKDDIETGEVKADVDEQEEVRFVVDYVDEDIMYDKGAMLHSKDELIKYVVERVAEMVARV